MGVGDAIINESVAWRRGYLVVAGRRLGRKTGKGRQVGQAARQAGQADQAGRQAGQAGRQSVNQAVEVYIIWISTRIDFIFAFCIPPSSSPSFPSPTLSRRYICSIIECGGTK